MMSPSEINSILLLHSCLVYTDTQDRVGPIIPRVSMVVTLEVLRDNKDAAIMMGATGDKLENILDTTKEGETTTCLIMSEIT